MLSSPLHTEQELFPTKDVVDALLDTKALADVPVAILSEIASYARTTTPVMSKMNERKLALGWPIRSVRGALVMTALCEFTVSAIFATVMYDTLTGSGLFHIDLARLGWLLIMNHLFIAFAELFTFILPHMLPRYERPAKATIAARAVLSLCVLLTPQSIVVIATLSLLLYTMVICFCVYIAKCGRINVGVTLYPRDNLLVVHSCGSAGKVRREQTLNLEECLVTLKHGHVKGTDYYRLTIRSPDGKHTLRASYSDKMYTELTVHAPDGIRVRVHDWQRTPLVADYVRNVMRLEPERMSVGASCLAWYLLHKPPFRIVEHYVTESSLL